MAPINFDIGILRGPMIMPVGLFLDRMRTTLHWQPLHTVKVTGMSIVKHPGRHSDTLESSRQARMLLEMTI